jgi:alpha-beta hydrolase superfamily lysophospholipase
MSSNTESARVAAALAALVLIASASTRASSSHAVTFRTDDGVTIAGTLYESPQRPAPAVILLHMLTRSREDWQAVADRLADAGISALAIDFRGHGQSTRGPAGPDGEPDLARMTLDVQAARAYLASHPDLVKLANIGIAGASIGANVAILEAAGDPAIKSLALLSPGLNYRALRAETAMQKYSPRPVLFVAATNDPYASRSVKQLSTLGAGLREIKTLENAGHGTTMLARYPDLVRMLVDWFERTLL